jgi:transcriptional regulator with XRE-family HTH domain
MTLQPNALSERRSAHTLVTTLKVLCDRYEKDRNCSQSDIARMIGVTRATLNKLLAGDLPLTYTYLERMALLFGVPSGIILCISLTTALARDSTNSVAPGDDANAAKLAVFAKYLFQLSRYIRESMQHDRGNRAPLFTHELASKKAVTWHPFLHEVMEATRGRTTKRNEDTVFTDLDRLRAMPPLRQSRPSNDAEAANGVATPLAATKKTSRKTRGPSKRGPANGAKLANKPKTAVKTLPIRARIEPRRQSLPKMTK